MKFRLSTNLKCFLLATTIRTSNCIHQAECRIPIPTPTNTTARPSPHTCLNHNANHRHTKNASLYQTWTEVVGPPWHEPSDIHAFVLCGQSSHCSNKNDVHSSLRFLTLGTECKYALPTVVHRALVESYRGVPDVPYYLSSSPREQKWVPKVVNTFGEDCAPWALRRMVGPTNQMGSF